MKSNASLFRRSLGAASWTMGGYAAAQILRLATNILLSRLLFPEAFGLVGAALLLLVGINLLTDIGIRQVATQSQAADDESFWSTLWLVQVFRGALIAAAGLIMAILLWSLSSRISSALPGTVYSEPELPLLVAGIAFTALVSGLESIAVQKQLREMKFKAITMMDLGSQVLSSITLLLSALYFGSVWALLIGIVSGSVVKTLFTHVFLPHNGMALKWSWHHWRHIWKFGRWITLSSILGYIDLNIDKLLVGALLDTRTFSLYWIASMLVSAASDLIGRVIGNVVYPALCEVQRNSPDRAVFHYRRLRSGLDTLLYFGSGLLAGSAGYIVGVLYDDRYQLAAPILAWLAFRLPLQSLSLMSQLFLARGLGSYLVIMALPRILGAVILFGILANSGQLAIVAAAALYGYAALPVALYLAHKQKAFLGLREIIFVPLMVPGYYAAVFVTSLLPT